MLGALARTDLAEPERAATHLAQLGDLSQEVVGKLDELVWVVNPRNDTIAGLAEYLGQYAEQLLRAAQIRCRFDFPANLPRSPLNADTRHQVFLAVKEALNNVVKHAGASEVHLRVVHDPGALTFIIEDNGRGFAASLPTADAGADGLVNFQERMKSVGGSCAITSTPGQGTRVELRIPVPESHPV
jgi:signal transduction histidine kinase